MNRAAIAFPLLAIFASGCNISTDQIALKNNRSLYIDSARELAPKWSMGVAVSKDGSLLATLENVVPTASNKMNPIQIRTWSGEVKKELQLTESQAFLPIMFGSEPNTLIGLRGDLVLSFNWESGQEHAIGKLSREVVDDFIRGRNFNHTLMTFPHAVVTSNGKLIKTHGMATFDMFGNAWFTENGKPHRVTPDGRVTAEPTMPSYRVMDQAVEQGSMRLVKTRQDFERQGAAANVTTIWLDEDRSMLAPDERKGDHKSPSAAVFSGLDVVAYGFVPGHDEVYVVTFRGTYFIPYLVSARGTDPRGA